MRLLICDGIKVYPAMWNFNVISVNLNKMFHKQLSCCWFAKGAIINDPGNCVQVNTNDWQWLKLNLEATVFLSHFPLDKMAATLADDNFKCFFLNENNRVWNWFSLKCVPRSPIDNKPVLVQVMAWRQTGNKPLSEPMLTQFTDAYMRH